MSVAGEVFRAAMYVVGCWSVGSFLGRQVHKALERHKARKREMSMTTHVGGGYCMCGRKLNSSSGGQAMVSIHENGKCVYARCEHGIVVVDTRTFSRGTY